MRVLRVATDGSYSKIVLGDWTFDHVVQCFVSFSECGNPSDVIFSSGGIPVFFGQLGTLITNADQGAFFSWDLDFNGASPAHQLTTITGSGTSTISLPVPGSFQPTLQGADGTLFGTVSLPPDPSGNPGPSLLTALDTLGNPKWTVPNLSPKYLTDDGSVIAQSPAGTNVTFDSSGNVTGQSTDSSSVSSWIDAQYATSTSGLASLALPSPSLAGTFAELPEGNHSGNNTAIEQVLTNQPQGDTEQLPPQGAATNSNYNAIELLTTSSPDYIFQTFIQTFDGARKPNNDIADVVSPPAGTPVNAAGQKITFALQRIASRGRGPFSVHVKRFDPQAHTISVATLEGHPLSGWRYWRAFSIGTNDIVIETGAVDVPGPGLKNYVGFYLTKSRQIKYWEEYLQYIQKKLGPGARQGSNPTYNKIKGEWNYSPQNYILNNVCQASTCN